MLVKRLDVTVQSFSWSDRAKVCVICQHVQTVGTLELNINQLSMFGDLTDHSLTDVLAA